MLHKPSLSRRTLFAIFTISGFSGLIYESIWSHYLKLFLGHAAYAQTLVLAIFMGGMALGSWLVARSASRLRNLLVAYAAVEALTGLIALVFHLLYGSATAFALDSVIPGIDSAWLITSFKWSLAAALILPQSILLGTTFPLISGGVIRRFPERSGETLAMLYFTNSLGAAFGVLVSGFFLIGKVGLPGTVMTAGLLNILLGLFVWVLARDEAAESKLATAVTPSLATNAAVKWICGAAFLAGLAAFAYEIAWIRMLSLVLGSSTHAFELMLSAFILGLALGGLWIRRRIDGYENPQRVLAVMFALMAMLASLTLPAYGSMFHAMEWIFSMFGATPAGYAGFNVLSHAIAAAMMIPTTIVAGMTLPLMTHYLLRESAGEAAIGKVYAANTVGAIVGVLLAIHLFLPNVGTKGTVIIGALAQLVVAAMLLLRITGAQRSGFSLTALATGVLVVLIIASSVRLDPLLMASGVYRDGIAKLAEGTKVTFLRDGKTATITLIDQNGVVVIATNGKPDAAINMGQGPAALDEVTMTLAGAVPLLMHPAPKRVANIGIGSGLTSHVVMASPAVEVLDSIEIEPAIVEATRAGFQPRVSNLFNDPRSHIHFEDAKTFFAATKQPYDIIISEPSNPWVSGVASLFSSEFYARVRRHLKPDGLLVQWVQIYETDISVVASVVKALSPHFSDYAIYNTDDSDILIIATVSGMLRRPDASAFKGALAAELKKVGVLSIEDVELRRIGTRKSLGAMFASYPVPANSDYFPFIDLNAPKFRFLRRNALGLGGMNLRPVPILALLGEPDLEPRIAPTAEGGSLARSEMLDQALALRAAITSGHLGGLHTPEAQSVLALRTPSERCADGGVTGTWLEAVKTIATRTTPNLAPADLAPVWGAIRASGCYAKLEGVQRSFVDYLEYVALRDRPNIIASGSRLLNENVLHSPEMHSDVILAVMASLLGTGDDQALAKLLQTQLPFVESQAQDDLSMRLVTTLAFARLGQPAGKREAVGDRNAKVAK
jgi:spermidine synthase